MVVASPSKATSKTEAGGTLVLVRTAGLVGLATATGAAAGAVVGAVVWIGAVSATEGRAEGASSLVATEFASSLAAEELDTSFQGDLFKQRGKCQTAEKSRG